MKIFFKLLAGLVPAFFVLSPALAQPASNCPMETQESNITNALPDKLLVATLEGKSLNDFFDKLRGMGLMGGTVSIDKVYIFTSEHHPDLYYVYFLAGGCIQDVRFTLKTLVLAALE